MWVGLSKGKKCLGLIDVRGRKEGRLLQVLSRPPDTWITASKHLSNFAPTPVPSQVVLSVWAPGKTIHGGRLSFVAQQFRISTAPVHSFRTLHFTRLGCNIRSFFWLVGSILASERFEGSGSGWCEIGRVVLWWIDLAGQNSSLSQLVPLHTTIWSFAFRFKLPNLLS